MKTKLSSRFVSAFIATGVLLGVSGTSFASTINVKVNGMVCSFCAQGIEKKFMESGSVSKVAVSLSDKRVTITEKEGGKIDDAAITQTLKNAGYTVEKIER